MDTTSISLFGMFFLTTAAWGFWSFRYLTAEEPEEKQPEEKQKTS